MAWRPRGGAWRQGGPEIRGSKVAGGGLVGAWLGDCGAGSRRAWGLVWTQGGPGIRGGRGPWERGLVTAGRGHDRIKLKPKGLGRGLVAGRVMGVARRPRGGKRGGTVALGAGLQGLAHAELARLNPGREVVIRAWKGNLGLGPGAEPEELAFVAPKIDSAAAREQAGPEGGCSLSLPPVWTWTSQS